MSKPLLDLFKEFILRESEYIFLMLAMAEQFERKGLKNDARILKAVFYSRQTIIQRFYRNLNLPENELVELEKIMKAQQERDSQLSFIDEMAKLESKQGCVQTVYFAKKSWEKEKELMELILENAKDKKDFLINHLAVCPLCGLILVEDLDRCPLCGANKAVFRIF